MSHFPSLVRLEAVLTSAALLSIGVELGILVERNRIRCVGKTEYMATVAAMVLPCEKAK